MSQQIQGANALSPGDLPMKRKRGRPRKDESSVQGESTYTADSMKKSKQSVDSGDGVDKMVGQVVSGVIEGSFDAGYLLNVKVGDTDTQLRGVVFQPGRFTPITVANDVAPHVRMYKRKEIPIPTLNQKSQPHGSVHEEKSDKQPIELENQAPILTDQCQPFQSQPGVPVALEHRSSNVLLPLADSTPPKNDSGLSLSGKVMPPQINEPVVIRQATSIMAQMECDKVVESSKVLQETEASTLMKGPNEVERNEKSKAEPESELLVDTLHGIEASKLTKGPSEGKINENLKSEPTFEPVVDLLPGIEGFQMKGPNEVDDSEISKTKPAPAPVSEILPGIETSKPVKGPNDEETNKESKEEPAPPPVNDIFQGIKADAEEPTIEYQALIIRNDLVHDEVKTQNLELNQPPPPVVAELKETNSEPDCKSVNNSMEKHVLPETQSGHAIEVSSGQGKPEGDATNTPGLFSLSTATQIQPEMMFKGETIPSESKLSSEEYVPPGPNELQICSPACVISGMECVNKDAIPPQES